MKSIIKKTLLVMMTPILCSCVGSTMVVYDHANRIGSVMSTTSTKISLSCQKCNGETLYQLVVKESVSLAINANISLEDGALLITVMDANKDLIFENTYKEDANFEVPLKEYGKQFIKINHSDFKGKYTFTWGK